MKCVLMNKNTEVVIAEYETNIDGFTEIYEVIDIDYAPLIIKKQYQNEPQNLTANLSKWFRNRGIPSWRDKLDILLTKLGIQTPEELLDKSFGLSLSDQYWLKPFDSDVRYDDINFFDHDFESADFLEASFSDSGSGKIPNLSLFSPNNTTDGMLRKTWVIENEKRFLLKGGYRGDSIQPFNEVLATLICEKLGFSHIPYSLGKVNEKIVSKCECFTTKDTEIVPAYQVMFGHEKYQMQADFDEYIRILEKHNLFNARREVENMIVLDYIIMNEDRHLNNFGIIRDANNLEWIDVMPIFDNGQALNVLSYGKDGITISGEGRFFYGAEKFDNFLGLIKDFSRFNFNKLTDVADTFRQILVEHMDEAKLTNERIDALCKVLSKQIEKISVR